MKATIDTAGRLVIPQLLLDRLGLMPGEVEVEVEADGTDLRVRAIASNAVIDMDGFLVVPPGGTPMTDGDVQALRDADEP